MQKTLRAALLTALALGTGNVAAAPVVDGYVLEAGHASLQPWLLADAPPHPADNAPSAARVELGKMLFFDPRLSGDGNMSCATCHNPLLGWSDGLPTAKGVKSRVLDRATPTIVNAAYNAIQMWDGRAASLEDQALGPMEANVEMNMDLPRLYAWLRSDAVYRAAFEHAYPDEEIGASTVARAIASFERTVVSKESPFDRWVRGDADAMTPQQVRGFAVFVDPAKGNCAVCHAAPNFTDDGFHNVGLASYGVEQPDLGRYAQKPLGLMKGAFKTPTLRDVAHTAPYFHDGSALTLEDVVAHYERGGEVRENLSPNMQDIALSAAERADLVAFLHALSSPPAPVVLPTLPTRPSPILVQPTLAPERGMAATE
ncbi:MAG: cytochrome c peroxidase [Gammaproteobacteria bacterium]